MMDMITIKAEITKQFRALGYGCNVSKFTKFTFQISGFSGGFSIGSANAKRFEIRVTSTSEDVFSVPCREMSDAQMEEEYGYRYSQEKYYATKRFTKKPESIPLVLEWLATAISTHSHLLALLHPESPLPDPRPFAEGTFIHSGSQTYHGQCESVEVRDIITTKGHQVIHTVFDPASTPYFLLELRVKGHGNVFMATDGDVWYPTMSIRPTEGPEANKSVYRIFPELPSVASLSKLNQNDKALIHAAIESYVDKNFSDTASPQAQTDRRS
jgi:hypothetical protein